MMTAREKNIAAQKFRLQLQQRNTVRRLLRAAVAVTGVDETAILSQRRDRDAVIARQLIMAAARRRGFSLAHIGRYLGRDHTTVLSGIRAVESAGDLRKLVDEIAAMTEDEVERKLAARPGLAKRLPPPPRLPMPLAKPGDPRRLVLRGGRWALEPNGQREVGS